ncbi:hypothetical protein AG0111_0g8577 [Alternaria gaisen]|uniref:Uncharacterized protein n=1 Tax=Alternaria gaisen TaxID=167740 RepID=A0ACB6FFT6_9PLEO|nr:hypothetical protein AG0111_0g8577 [Alternaria gaisen]
MAVSLQHFTNRTAEPDVAQQPFRNDSTNIAALQSARAQQKAMEEAALRQEERFTAMTKEKEEDKLALRTALDEAHQQLSESRNTIRDMKERAEKAETLRIIHQEETAASETRMEGQLESLRNTIIETNARYSYGGKENCLPRELDGVEVMIVNMRSGLAIDAGKWEGMMGHGHSFNPDNSNQKFRLNKVNNRDDSSSENFWTITLVRNGYKLYFPSGGTSADLQAGPWGTSERSYHWRIGAGGRNGTWLIKNAEWNTYIELESSSRQFGVNLKSYNFSDDYNQHWIILPFDWKN